MELWEFDGKTNPKLLKDINVGFKGSSPTNLTVVHGKLYFLAQSENEINLWVYDGVNPPYMFNELYKEINFLWAGNLHAIGDNIIFNASMEGNSSQTWIYNGATQPTRQKDINGSELGIYFNNTNSGSAKSISEKDLLNRFVEHDIQIFD